MLNTLHQLLLLNIIFPLDFLKVVTVDINTDISNYRMDDLLLISHLFQQYLSCQIDGWVIMKGVCTGTLFTVSY